MGAVMLQRVKVNINAIWHKVAEQENLLSDRIRDNFVVNKAATLLSQVGCPCCYLSRYSESVAESVITHGKLFASAVFASKFSFFSSVTCITAYLAISRMQTLYISDLYHWGYVYDKAFTNSTILKSDFPIDYKNIDSPEICYPITNDFAPINSCNSVEYNLHYVMMQNIWAKLMIMGIHTFNPLISSTLTEILNISFRSKLLSIWLKDDNNQLALNVVDPKIATESAQIIRTYTGQYISSLIPRVFMFSDTFVLFSQAMALYTASTALANSGLNYNFFYVTAFSFVTYLTSNFLISRINKLNFNKTQDSATDFSNSLEYSANNALQIEANLARAEEYNTLQGLLGRVGYGAIKGAAFGATLNIVSTIFSDYSDVLIMWKSTASIASNPALYLKLQVAMNLNYSLVNTVSWFFGGMMGTSGLEHSYNKIVKFRESISFYKDFLSQNKELEVKRGAKSEISLQGLTLFKPLSADKIKTNAKKDVLVSNIDFAFKKGVVAGVVGKSGCGKSCLFNAIFGNNPFAKGLINSTTQNNIVYVPQKPVFKNGLNLKQLLTYTLDDELKNLKTEKVIELGEKIRNWIKKLDIEHLLNKEIENKSWLSSVSGGEGQRLAILQALVRIWVKRTNRSDDTILLLLDESIGALDPDNRSSAFDLIREEVKANDIVAIHIDHSEKEVIAARYNEYVIDFNKLLAQQKAETSMSI